MVCSLLKEQQTCDTLSRPSCSRQKDRGRRLVVIDSQLDAERLCANNTTPAAVSSH